MKPARAGGLYVSPQIIMTRTLQLIFMTLYFGLCGTIAVAADLSPSQKDGVCRVSLARINGNSQGEYRIRSKAGDTVTYVSARGYAYSCEVFSEGMVLTLSNDDWGRLKPTGSITTEGKCSKVKLFDPGFGVTHELKSCSK